MTRDLLVVLRDIGRLKKRVEEVLDKLPEGSYTRSCLGLLLSSLDMVLTSKTQIILECADNEQVR